MGGTTAEVFDTEPTPCDWVPSALAASLDSGTSGGAVADGNTALGAATTVVTPPTGATA